MLAYKIIIFNMNKDKLYVKITYLEHYQVFIPLVRVLSLYFYKHLMTVFILYSKAIYSFYLPPLQRDFHLPSLFVVII